MVESIMLFIFGLVLLIRGGDWFVDSACGIAHRFRMPEILIGATIVSIGTTLPEVMVSAQAAAAGQGGIAYGNAIGSIICNTALIAAITIAVRPPQIERKTFMLPVIFFFVAAAVYLVAAYAFRGFSLAIGIILLVIFVAFMVITVYSAIKEGKAEKKLLASNIEPPKPPEKPQSEAEEEQKSGGILALIRDCAVIVGALVFFVMSFFDSLSLASAIVALCAVVLYFGLTVVNAVLPKVLSHSPKPNEAAVPANTPAQAEQGSVSACTAGGEGTAVAAKSQVASRLEMVKSIVFLVIGAAIIALGADLLVDNGTIIAEKIGVPQSVIGLTFVAIGTSLPELVTAITSLIKKHGSLSLGNIIGANLFNLVLVCGISIVISPFGIPEGNTLAGLPASLVLDLPVMLFVMMFLTLPAIIRGKLARWQGIVMLCVYAAFFAVQFAL